MNRINFIVLFACALLFTATSCGQQASIVNRWWVAGQLNSGKIVPLNSKSQEFEFLKGNTFNIYEKGVVKENGSYTVASDKKSILLNNGSRNKIPIKILKVTATQLHMIFDVAFSRTDTVVCYAQGSDLAKKAQENAAALKEMANAWGEMNGYYEWRKSIIEGFVHWVKSTSNSDAEIFNRTFTLIRGINTFKIKPDNLTKESVGEYETIQAEMSKCIQDLLAYAKQYPSLTSSKIYSESIEQLTDAEKKIDVSKTEFKKTFAAYTKLK